MIDISSILTEAVKAGSLGVMGVVGGVIVKYGPKILREVWVWIETKAKANNLEYVLKEATLIWNQVEEDYRISSFVSNAVTSKADEFDKLLLKKFPSLSQEELTKLRQSIAGEYNKDKVNLITSSAKSCDSKVADSDPVDTTGWMSEEEAYKIQAENDKLKADLATANKKLNAAASAITGIGGTINE